MAEYISRETLLNAVEKLDRLDKETNTKYEYDKKGYILLIQNAPTADVVEVVRCEDCKHGKKLTQFRTDCTTSCELHNKMMIDNDFCSYGERK